MFEGQVRQGWQIGERRLNAGIDRDVVRFLQTVSEVGLIGRLY